MPNIVKSAEYLALCGDIGKPSTDLYREFIAKMSSEYKQVFLISGNHEYYSAHSDMNEINETIRAVCDRFPNVTFLHNSSHVIDRTRFVGCTLWTNAVAASSYLEYGMNDYHQIRKKVYMGANDQGGSHPTYRRVKISANDTTALHNESVEFIKGELAAATQLGQEVVMLTHHLPTFQNIHKKYEGNRINYGYATDLEYLINAPIRAWIHGHTHQCMESVINGVPVVSNPLGYPGENTQYRPDKFIEFGDTKN